MSKIRPFTLYPSNTIFIAVEGVGQWVFERPHEEGEAIFDRIIDSSATHNFKSMTRVGSSIFINFVIQDDEVGYALGEEEVRTLYKWLCTKPLSDEELIDEFLDELGNV